MRHLTILLLLCACAALADPPAGRYDLVIRGGRVADGTGNPAFGADVAVKDGRIVEIGRVAGAAASEIDARGMIVAPGFIDVHTHAENVTSLPRAENFVRMGVTSIVVGNCGGSRLDLGVFFKQIEEKGASVNVASLIGHNTVRSEAMGGSFDRAPTDTEMEKMKSLVEDGMKAGAVGLSTGLIYLPGTFAKPQEIIEVARIAARYDGIYATHMRNEGTRILDSLAEVFRIAREAGIRAEVSHIKLSPRAAWGKTGAVLAAIEKARAEGLDITQDQYVYTASSTGLSQLVPAGVREGGIQKYRERIGNPEMRAKIIAQMKEGLSSGGRDSYAYAVIADYPTDRSLNGKTIPEAAKVKRGADTLDEQVELILEIHNSGGGSGIYHSMNEEDLQQFLRHPNTMIASDSGAKEPGEGVPHPRGYGNNARVLARYVRELKVLRLEDAVRKMTSLPATTFRLKDRGLLREGYWADVVVFDPQRVQDTAQFGDPNHYASGIRDVLVNGIAVVKDGEHTGAFPGRPLRHVGRQAG